jgi:hypothetical protein
VTVAIAYQFSISVDDPKATPKEVRDLVKDMDRELRAISNDESINVIEAANRLDAVIARYVTLTADLVRQRDTAQEETSPDASSAPTEPPPTADPGEEPTTEPGSGSGSPEPTPSPESETSSDSAQPTGPSPSP